MISRGGALAVKWGFLLLAYGRYISASIIVQLLGLDGAEAEQFARKRAIKGSQEINQYHALSAPCSGTLQAYGLAVSLEAMAIW